MGLDLNVAILPSLNSCTQLLIAIHTEQTDHEIYRYSQKTFLKCQGHGHHGNHQRVYNVAIVGVPSACGLLNNYG